MSERESSPPRAHPKPEFGQPLKKQSDQSYLFAEGEDLPLISGTPQQVVVPPFIPEQRTWKQRLLPGIPGIDYDAVLAADQELRRVPREPLTEERSTLFTEEQWQGNSDSGEPRDTIVEAEPDRLEAPAAEVESEWDMAAIVAAISPERHEIIRHDELGQGMRFELGADTRTSIELYPAADVTRILNQHMEIMLYRQVKPLLMPTGIVFEQSIAGTSRRLTLTSQREIALTVAPVGMVAEREHKDARPETTEGAAKKEAQTRRTDSDPTAEEQARQLQEVIAPFLNLRQLRRLASQGSDALHAALRSDHPPQEVVALLAALVALLRPVRHEQVTSPADIAALLMVEMGHLEQEHLRVVCLNSKNYVQKIHTVYKGSINSSPVRVAEVFREPIRLNSAAIIMAHNHPSSDPSPSPEDILVTHQMVEAGKLLGIDVLDHLVIGQGRWVSLLERGAGFNG